METFAYAFNYGDQEVLPGADITFNQTPIPNPLPTGLAFATPSTINISLAGIYDVKYFAIPENANITLALFLDGVEVVGSRYTVTSSAGNVYGQSLVVIQANNLPATLTLRNVDPLHTALITGGELANTVSASILIEKIG